MLEKITLFDLVEPTSSILIEDDIYNSKTQVRFNILDPISATTFNQTQTFDSKGKAKDKDNDK